VHLGFGKDLVSEVWAKALGRIQINVTAENPGQFLLHREERQAGDVARIEFHEHVHVAVLPEILSEHRAEQREPAYVMAAAELRDPFVIDDHSPHPE
jgi:hypothetical protein